MSTLTKVFAVLLVVVCIAFSMSVTQFLVTSRDESKRADKAEEEAAVEKAAVVAAGLRRTAAERQLNEAVAAKIAADQLAQAERTDKDMLIDRQQTENADLRAKLTTAEANVDSALKLVTQTTKLYEQLSEQVEALRVAEAKQIQIATSLRDEKRTLVREGDGYKFRIEQQERRIRDLNDRNRDLRSRLIEAGPGRVAAAPSGGGVTGEVRPNITIGEPLYGRVKSVSNNLAVISVGEDDGVSKGMKFLVFRGEKLLATFVADKVEPQETAGMLINVKTAIKGGDNVLSNPRLF